MSHAETTFAARLSEAHNEIAALTLLLRKDETGTTSEAQDLKWLRRVAVIRMSAPAWWGLLPLKARRNRQFRLLARKGVFDAEAYLRLYPDVAESGIDPLVHYIVHGMDEGRQRPLPLP